MIRKATVSEIDDRARQEIIGETIAKTMRQLMNEGRLIMDDNPRNSDLTQQPRCRQNNNKAGSGYQPEVNQGKSNKSFTSRSEAMIYKQAIQSGLTDMNINSLSSDEIDTSDEAINPNQSILLIQNVTIVDDVDFTGRSVEPTRPHRHRENLQMK